MTAAEEKQHSHFEQAPKETPSPSAPPQSDPIEQQEGAAPSAAVKIPTEPTEMTASIPEAKERTADAPSFAAPMQADGIAVSADPAEDTSAEVVGADPVKEASVGIVNAAPAEEASTEAASADPTEDTSAAVASADPAEDTSAAVANAVPAEEANAEAASADLAEEANAEAASADLAEEANAVSAKATSADPVKEASAAVASADPAEEASAEVVGADPVKEANAEAASADPTVKAKSAVSPVKTASAVVASADPVKEASADIVNPAPAEEASAAVASAAPADKLTAPVTNASLDANTKAASAAPAVKARGVVSPVKTASTPVPPSSTKPASPVKGRPAPMVKPIDPLHYPVAEDTLAKAAQLPPAPQPVAEPVAVLPKTKKTRPAPKSRRELHLKQNRRQRLLRWLMSTFLAALLIVFLFGYCFRPLRMGNASMEPTLLQGETVMYSPISKFFSIPSRSDVVVFRDPKTGELLVKRIVALPGETVSMTHGVVLIDRTYRLDESAYVKNADLGMAELTVPENCVFVLSDNRVYGGDSRDESVGCIPYSDILGVVCVRFERFAILN